MNGHTPLQSPSLFGIINGNVRSLFYLKLLLFNSGLSPGICVSASKRRGLRSHPSRALLSQPENAIHHLSSPHQKLLSKVYRLKHTNVQRCVKARRAAITSNLQHFIRLLNAGGDSQSAIL